MAYNTVTPAIFGLAGARVVPPQDIGLTYKTNLFLWLRGGRDVYVDNGTTPAVNNDTIYLWKDQSGNGYHATQTSAGNRPLYKTNIIGAQPVTRYNGTNTKFDFADIETTNPDIVSFFMVVIPSSTTPIGIWSTDYGAGGRPIRNEPADRWDVYGEAPSTQMQLANTNPVLMEFIHTCNGSMKKTLTYYKNGTYVDYHETGDGAIASDWYGPRLGTINDGYAWYTGDIAEFIIYNEAISNNNRALVELYIRNKYGIW